MIQVKVNGEIRDVPEGTTLLALAEELKINLPRAAFELNRQIVKKTLLGETILKEGDVLEIVTFVGGG